MATPPSGLVVREHLGLITAPAVDGQVVYRTERGTLFETRAVKTPGGDYLLMFPTNTLAVPEGRCHYGRQDRKANDLVAFRSSDRGATWHGPTRPIDIDYNLHGFIPLMPRAGNGVPEGRIYCFGTQPIWALHTTKRGLHENAPIGYRYSDDDGHTWMGHTCLNLGTQAWDCGNYDWVIEVAPDTLLAAYAETDRNDPRRSAILGTWITVKPT